MQPTVKLSSSGNSGHKALLDGISKLTERQVYVGVPSTTAAERQKAVQRLLKRRKGAPTRGVEQVNNAQLVYIHTHGSHLRNIPPRPIIEPAIEERSNREAIAVELKGAAEAALDGKPAKVDSQLRRAGLEAQNRVRAWFTDPRNHWAPNAPSTIRRKGSSRPLIDTGALRQAITFVVGKG